MGKYTCWDNIDTDIFCQHESPGVSAVGPLLETPWYSGCRQIWILSHHEKGGAVSVIQNQNNTFLQVAQ